MRLFVVLLFLFIGSARAERVEINRILFNAGNTSWSIRDHQVFKYVLTQVYKRKHISDYSVDEMSDFILSRMAAQEGETFGISYDKATLTDAQRKKNGFTQEEVDREVESVARAIAFTEIKESYHQDAKRFNAWFEVMRRKYQVKIKSVNNRDLK